MSFPFLLPQANKLLEGFLEASTPEQINKQRGRINSLFIITIWVEKLALSQMF